MITIAFYLTSFFDFIFAKNKVLFYFSFFLLLTLFCFNTDNADYLSYKGSMESSVFFSETTRISGYWALLKFFAQNEIDFQFLYVLIGGVYLITLSLFLKKFSLNPNIVVGYYMVGIFLLDVVQLKNTLAMTFILWGFYILFSSNQSLKKKLIFFGILVLCSSKFHLSGMYFLLFLFLPLSFKTLIKISTLITVVIFVGGYFIVDRLVEVGSSQDNFIREYGAGNILATQLTLIAIAVLFAFAFFLFRKKTYYIQIYKTSMALLSEKNKGLNEYGLKVVVLSMPLIPLISLNADFRRVFFFLSIIWVTVVSNWITNKSKFILSFPIAFIALFLLNRYVLLGNYEAVFCKIFQNNMIWGG